MGPCIYCTAPALSREHWIPRGLGAFRGYTPLLDRLCEDCNNFLGRELDEEFIRTGAIGFQRGLYGIQGRSGSSSVNPFLFRATASQQPTEMLMPVPHASHLILGEAYRDADGNKCARPLRQIVVRKPDGPIARIPFNRAWSAEQLREAIANRRLEGCIPVEVYFDDDEGNREAVKARDLLRSVFGDLSEAVAFMGAGNREVKPIRLAAGITRRYIRGLAKTAFHYHLWACPILRGDEPQFSQIRDFIRRDTGEWRELVQIEAQQFIPMFRGREPMVPRHTSHLFHSALSRDAILSWVQFFVGPDSLPPPSKVTLAIRPSLRFARTRHLRCHQARYFDPDERDDGHDGEIVEIPVWEQRVATL
jgi:hypothetical protein